MMRVQNSIVDGQFLDSSDPKVRRLSAAAYAGASAMAAAYVFGVVGFQLFKLDPWSMLVVIIGPVLVIWWVTAGVLLRVVRNFDKRGDR